MASEQLVILRVDPLDPLSSLVFPAVSQRVLEMMRETMTEADPILIVRQLLARVAGGDPGILLLAFVGPLSGRVRGHLLCTLETLGDSRWVYGWQAKVDGDGGDVLTRAFAQSDAWGASMGATQFVMTTRRPEKAWERKYGFESMRHFMSRSVPHEAKGGDSASG